MSEERQLPRYQCHKVVSAAKISLISGNRLTLRLPDGLEFDVSMTSDWFKKHQPEQGGYYVRYDDEYVSFSPKNAFEGGYKLIAGSEHDHRV